MNDKAAPEEVDVLAVGAHPDDVELAIGGTVRLLVDGGYRVAILDLTGGEMGTRGTPEDRAREAAEAARILGAVARHGAGLKDGHVLPDDAARDAVVRALRRFRPALVLAPNTEDYHPDHKWGGVVVREAAFLAGLRRLETGQPPFRPRSILHYALHTQFEPDIVVDVSTTFETKRQACLAFKSQFHDPESSEPATYISSEGFWEWWEGRARHYGNLVGARYGEPFRHEGPLPVDDPVALFRSFGYYPHA